MSGEDSVEGETKLPATHTKSLGETKPSAVAKTGGKDSTNMINHSAGDGKMHEEKVNVPANDANCSAAMSSSSTSSSLNPPPENPDEQKMTKIRPALSKKGQSLKRPAPASVAKASSPKSKIAGKQQLTKEEIELEQRREASRISSRRSQERQKRRIEYLAKEETRLQDVNAKQREENESLRNMIQHIKSRLGTAPMMQDTAVPRLDQPQAAGLANRGVGFLQSHQDQFLSGLADHGTGSAAGFSQHHAGIPPTMNSSIANTAGLLDTTSLLNRQNFGRSAALGMLGGALDQNGHGSLPNALLSGSSSIPAWSSLDSDPSLTSQLPSTVRGDLASANLAVAAGTVIPNPIQQELAAIEAAIRQSRASLAASANRPAVPAESLENLRNLVGGTAGFAANNELGRTSALGELRGASIHNSNVAQGTRQYPLSSSTEGNRLDSFLAASQSQQQQPTELLGIAEAARRNQMDLALLLRGGRDLTSYGRTAEESMGLLSSNNLVDAANREPQPGMDINSALGLQRGLGMNPSVVAPSSLYPQERSILNPPQTNRALSPSATSVLSAMQNKKKANETRHGT